MIWENPRLKKQQQQHVSSLKDFLVLLTPQRALEDPRREWRTKRFPNVWTHPFLEAHLQGLVFPRPRTPGQLPPERPPKAASDHPASSDICLWCLPVDKVKKNRQLRKPRGRKGWRKGSSLTVFSKKKKEKKNTYCCYFFKTWLCIMTAQCGKFRHFKKYDMKTFKSNSSPGNYGLQDLF